MMAEIAFTYSNGTAVDLATGVEIVDRLDGDPAPLEDVFKFPDPQLDIELDDSLYLVKP